MSFCNTAPSPVAPAPSRVLFVAPLPAAAAVAPLQSAPQVLAAASSARLARGRSARPSATASGRLHRDAAAPHSEKSACLLPRRAFLGRAPRPEPGPSSAAPAAPRRTAGPSASLMKPGQAATAAELQEILRDRVGLEGNVASSTAACVVRRHRFRDVPSAQFLNDVLDLLLVEWKVPPAAAARCVTERPSIVNAGAEELRRRMEIIRREIQAAPPQQVVAEYISLLAQKSESLEKLASGDGFRRPFGSVVSSDRLDTGREAMMAGGFNAKTADYIAQHSPSQAALVTEEGIRELVGFFRDDLELSEAEIAEAMRRQPCLVSFPADAFRARVAFLTSPEGGEFGAEEVRTLFVKWSAIFTRDLVTLRSFVGGLRERGFDVAQIRRALRDASFAVAKDVNVIFARVESALARLGVEEHETLGIIRAHPTLLGSTYAVAENVEWLLKEGRKRYGVTPEMAAQVARMSANVLCLRHETTLKPKLRAFRDFGVVSEVGPAPKVLAFSLERRIWPRLAICLSSDGTLRHPTKRRVVKMRSILEMSEKEMAEYCSIHPDDWAAFLRGAKEALARARADGWPEEGAPDLTRYVATIQPVYEDDE
eukprot:tig00000219_g19505.t1